VQILCWCTEGGGLPGKKIVTGCTVFPISVKTSCSRCGGRKPSRLNVDWNPVELKALGRVRVALHVNGTVIFPDFTV
jgi:hypothetical protein